MDIESDGYHRCLQFLILDLHKSEVGPSNIYIFFFFNCFFCFFKNQIFIKNNRFSHECKTLGQHLDVDLVSYLDVNNLLCEQQHGFVPKKSTSSAVFEMLKNVYQNWNDKMYTVCTFVDFSRAFDSIDHNILIRKLRLYGFDETLLKFSQVI